MIQFRRNHDFCQQTIVKATLRRKDLLCYTYVYICMYNVNIIQYTYCYTNTLYIFCFSMLKQK